MRVRVGQAAFVGVVLTVLVTSTSCQTAGLSRAFMAVDTQGNQPRKVFFTDSIQVVAIAVSSSSRNDVTINVKIRQTAAWDWDGDQAIAAIHDVFAVGEATPSPGVEAVNSFTIPSTGIVENVQCYGQCVPNSSPGSDPCPVGDNRGPDSCGIGATCCYLINATQPVMPSMDVLPFPVGSYATDFYIDGVYQSSSPFDILFPDTPDPKFSSDPTHGCPTQPPDDGIPCRYWVRKNTQCTGFNSSKVCTCTSDNWSCQ